MSEIKNNNYKIESGLNTHAESEDSPELESEIKESVETSAKQAIEEIYPEASEKRKNKILEAITEKLPKMIDAIDKVVNLVEPRDRSNKECLKAETKKVLYTVGVTAALTASCFGIGPGQEGAPGTERIKKIIEGIKNW